MSRMTSAQVISLGEYLDTDFDPSSLTVSQLLGVLGFHNVNYPTPYSKPKLIQLFNAEIKSQTDKLRKERLKKQNSIASDEGITDGVTGKPLSVKNPSVTRRSSRRLSHAPEEETSPVRPDPPKRRRSSAQPSLGGPSHRLTYNQPTLVEESEPDDVSPIRKVSRSKKISGAAGAQARRVSNMGAEDSGWEDNNIFQSGAESSSPARPSPIRKKGARKGGIPRKSRKSSSAPPQMLLSSSPVQSPSIPEDSPYSPPQSNFHPDLPSIATRERLPAPIFTRTILNLVEDNKVLNESDDELDLRDNGQPLVQSEVINEVTENEEEEESQRDQTTAFSPRIVEDGKATTPRIRHSLSPEEPKPTTFIVRLFYLMVAIGFSIAILNFKFESSPIGYCDTGVNTNNALEQLRNRRSAIEACNRENRTLLYLPPRASNIKGENGDANMTPCPLPSLLPLPYPDSCTPCPEHGKCAQYSVTCDVGYLLRPPPILFFLPAVASTRNISLSSSLTLSQFSWKVLSTIFDGLPGLGSVALSPRCTEDPRRKRNIGVLGKAIEAYLGQERGRRLCTGGKTSEAVPDAAGGEAKRWGVAVKDLREMMRQKTKPHLLNTFDDTFTEAIQQLTQWGGIIMTEDLQQDRYVAHRTPNLTWNCVVTVKFRETWNEWRIKITGTAFIFVCLLFGRASQAKRRIENKRVAGLVQIALDTLRAQELAHHIDPVTAPYPYLSSVQLRDLILQEEHSVAHRSRLWNKVERVVEGNANVRTNQQEMQGGDEMRVWYWVGSAGRGQDVQKENKVD
ncbi:Man1-Src1p-C-terminal domain-containing protein [Collybia nuda]|uniref:Man1-Src1p-C-terminal domain-containing protein n=1 Tax=Collybia nuda TaxID=64659 RepID=A0A9P6CLE1_9AGAR|nr:Man1-Src1p-C-terminal domain-containing protein [Collybia nuda]